MTPSGSSDSSMRPDRLSDIEIAGRALVDEGCREELGAPSYDKCWKPAEFILWGKLIPTEGLGPRCHEHAAKHVGEEALRRKMHGAPLKLEYAIADLRPLRWALDGDR